MASIQPYGDPNAHGKINDSLNFRRAQNSVSLQKNHTKQTQKSIYTPAPRQAFKEASDAFKKLWNKTLDWFKKKSKKIRMNPRSLYLQKYLKDTLPQYTEKLDVQDIIDFGATVSIGAEVNEIYIDVKVLQPSTNTYLTIGTLEQSSNIYTPKAIASEEGKVKLTFYSRQSIARKYCFFYCKFEELLEGVIPAEVGNDGTPDYTSTFSPGKFGNALDQLTQNKNIDFNTSIPDMGRFKLSAWFKLTGAAINILMFKEGGLYFGIWTNFPTTSRMDIYVEKDGDYLFYRTDILPIVQDEWFNIILDVNNSNIEGERVKLYFNGNLALIDTIFSDIDFGNEPLNINMMNLWSSNFNVLIDDLKIFSYDIPLSDVIANAQIEGLGGDEVLVDVPVPFDFELRAKYQTPLGNTKGMTVRTGEMTLPAGGEVDLFLSTDLSLWYDTASRELSGMT